MPNLKISQFTNLAGLQTPTDVIPVVVGSAAPNYKLTLNDLFATISYNTTEGATQWEGVSAPTVSDANSAKLYYAAGATQKLMLSRDNGAYQQLIVGSPSFPLSVSNSTGQITATTSAATAAISNPGILVTRGDGKRNAQLLITADAAPAPQLLLSSEVITAQGDNVNRVTFTKTDQGGGQAPNTATLGTIQYSNGTGVAAWNEVRSIQASGGIGVVQTWYSSRKNTFGSAGIFGIDDWGTFRVSRNIGPFYSDVAGSDPTKLMIIGNVDNLNDSTNVCLHILNSTAATNQTNLLLQAVTSQSTNLFETKTAANTKTLQISTTGIMSPASAGGVTLGTNALPFSSFYLGAAATNNIQLTGTATAARVATFPDASGTVQYTTTANVAIPTSTLAGLPAAPTLTQLYSLTNDNRGLIYYNLQAAQWVSNNGHVYNVKDFGAKGDGSTNDATAIQAAFDDSPSGAIIYFPTGQYKINSTITASLPKILIGDGNTETGGIGTASTIVGSLAGYLIDFTLSGIVGGVGTNNIRLVNQNTSTGGAVNLYQGGCPSYFQNTSFQAYRCLTTNLTFTVTVMGCSFVGIGAGFQVGSWGISTNSHVNIFSSDFTLFENGIRLSGAGAVVKGSRIERNIYGIVAGIDSTGSTYQSTALEIGGVTCEANDYGIHIAAAAAWSIDGVNIYGTTNAPSGQSITGLLIQKINSGSVKNAIINGSHSSFCISCAGPSTFENIVTGNTLGGTWSLASPQKCVLISTDYQSLADGDVQAKVLYLRGAATGAATYFALTGTPTGTRTVTFPDSSTSIAIASQTLTFTGPTAARIITLPDANFTAARTDAANTFTGTQTFSGAISVNTGASAAPAATIRGSGAVAIRIAADAPYGRYFQFANAAASVEYGSIDTLSDGALVMNIQTGPSFRVRAGSTDLIIFKADGLLQFAGTTSSFPALKRNGTAIDIRLGDDSAYGNLSAGIIVGNSTSALALAIGGITNPQLQVDCSAASIATGVKVTGAAAGSGVTIAAISSGSNEALIITPKGTGALRLSHLTSNGVVTTTGSNGTLAVVAGGFVSRLTQFFADAGNSTTVETDLYSYTLAAGKLATNGDSLFCQFSGTLAASATATRTIKLYFGGTAIFDSTGITVSAGSTFNLQASIIREDASTVRYVVTLTVPALTAQASISVSSLGSLTLANTQAIKITGQAGGAGAATNDIIAKLGQINYTSAT